MIKQKLFVLSTFFSLLTSPGCATTTQNDTVDNSDRSPADAEWIQFSENTRFELPGVAGRLIGLGKSHILFGKPSSSCLQSFIDQKIQATQKLYKNGDVGDYPGDPNLAENIILAAEAAGIDPYIFAGIVHQESGDFIPRKNGGGSGLTAMTGIAVTDACYKIETDECKVSLSNPDYQKRWDEKAAELVSALFPDSKTEAEYPWNKYCTTPPKNFCESRTINGIKKYTCGISDACMKQIRNGVYKNNRTSLLMGSFTFMNILAASLGSENEKGEKLKQSYIKALRNYNGHPDHMIAYPGNVMSKLNAIKKRCPPLK